jgi:hypothetical protein
MSVRRLRSIILHCGHLSKPITNCPPLETNLHSPQRQLIELRMEHADLNALIDRISHAQPLDELMLQRLKKRRLRLRDRIASMELKLDPKEPA